MKRLKYNRNLKNILNLLKQRLNYKRQLNRIIYVLAILVLLLLLKRLNNKISSNIIEIIDNSIHYKVNIKEDSKVIIDFSKRFLQLPEKALSVLNINEGSKYIPPIEGAIYNPFGEVKYLDGSSKYNNGIDIIPSGEKEAVAIDKGIILSVEDKGSHGYYITIEHEDIISVYGYLINTYVDVGDEVIQGTKIGTLGTKKDGNKYLHFEIWEDGTAVNPSKYIKFNKRL